MPTYQYRCLNCNLEFELKQSFHDKPIADCPTCHGMPVAFSLQSPSCLKGRAFM